MIKNVILVHRLKNISLTLYIIFGVCIFSAYSQQMPKMIMDTSVIKQKDLKNTKNQMMLPMAFFTHMGIPLDVGTYSLRVAALPTYNKGKTNIQFNYQFETGLSKTVGLFLGGDGFFEDPTLEAMFQFLVWKSRNGNNGFSPIIEFEFPLGEEATRSVYTLVGFSTTLSNSRIAFNQVLHYSPLEDLAEGSASFVIKVSKQIFLVPEISGVASKDTHPISNMLFGLKIKFNNNFLLGFAYQLPLTTNRNYSSQYIFQPNIMIQK